MSTTVTLRPNGTITLVTATVVGAASAHAALSDNSDASYVEFPHTVSSDVKVDLGTFTLPTLAQVRLVTARVRGATTTPGDSRTVYIDLSGSAGGGPSPVFGGVNIVGNGLASYSSSHDPHQFMPVWIVSQADIDAMTFRMHPMTTGGFWPAVRIYEAYFDIVYNEVPVTAVTGPTGTITTRSDPPVVWTYTDPDGDAQERYQVKIFTAAQQGIGGFNPDTSPYTWSSGEVFSPALTVTPPALANATYYAYVKVADVGSSGRYSAWAISNYAINVVPLPSPTMGAVAQPDLSRVQLLSSVGTYAPGAQKVSIERSIDGGVTWAVIRGAFEVVVADQGTLVAYDYEMPRGVAVHYRSRAVSDITGGRMTSPYSTSAIATVTPTGWWLKDPQFPALNMLIVVAPDFAPRRKIPQTVYEGLGATTSVVVTDGARGYDGTLTVWCKTAERYAKLDALVDGGRPLLLENSLGQAWYVQIGDASSWELIRAAPIAGETSPVRHFHAVSLSWTQVAAPSGVTQGAGTPTG